MLPSIRSLGMFRSLYESASAALLLLLLPLFLKYVFIVICFFFLQAAKFEYHRIMVSNLGRILPKTLRSSSSSASV